MPGFLHRLLVAATLSIAALSVSSQARAQDLYDPAVLRTLNLNFHDANWLTLLRQNYLSETLILADLTVDGVTYPNVGVRIRGNTSYTALPAGSEKFSLKVELGFVNPEQELLGHDELNLNNGFRDPTFSREVVYNNFVAQFIANPRANHVLLTLQGQNWGVYINVQQPKKRMLRDYFANADGVRIGCSNNPNGPGLAYNGPNASGYTAYQVNNDGGFADPLSTLIAVASSLSNEPLSSWQNIDNVFAIDPSIWSVALENMLTDDDSYINKGCDFMTYRDPLDSRMHLLQRDANETFTQSSWAITRNFTATNKPVLSRVLAVPELRQRYMAHYRTLRSNLNWTYFGPRFAAQRALIDAAVQADPKKLYSYTLFQNNYTSTVNMPLGGLAGGSIAGLEQFVNARGSFLDGSAEFVASGPQISAAQASDESPDPAAQVWITASVSPAGSAVAGVQLYYRPNPNSVYSRVAMLDNGASGDGAAGDGVYGALLPVSAVPGQRVSWYVAATSANAFNSLSFLPALAERGPNTIQYTFGSSNGMRITEWMYAGVSGEFVEFTNRSALSIDMTGWSMDDSNATAGAFDLSAFGVVQPGESVVVTEGVASAFRAAWGLAPGVKIIGELGVLSGNNFGRGDQINLYATGGALQDRLTYGDQTIPGSIRTQERSGQAPCSAIGQDDVLSWQLSTVGDVYGSFAASTLEVGTPGSFTVVGSCGGSGGDVLFADGFEASL